LIFLSSRSFHRKSGARHFRFRAMEMYALRRQKRKWIFDPAVSALIFSHRLVLSMVFDPVDRNTRVQQVQIGFNKTFSLSDDFRLMTRNVHTNFQHVREAFVQFQYFLLSF